ncbi:ADP-ribosylglycohydrolase family protein [Candidatus Pacearchaeota archaeon]|nr:ADP-ribosylglycohydrolase family protein [Candidatus Pacearchaeota archaeon]
MVEIKDRFLGCIYGLAIGDALGYPVEYMKREEKLRELGPEGVTGFTAMETNPKIRTNIAQHIGSYSDDTQMTLATARGILKSDIESIGETSKNIAEEYVLWGQSPENNRSPGTTCMAGIRKMASGIDWQISGIPLGDGCGAAMRTAPIGLVYFRKPQQLKLLAYNASRCTHAEESAIASGIGVAKILGAILNEQKPLEILEDAIIQAELRYPQSRTLAQKLRNVKRLVKNDRPDTYKDLATLGEGWRGDEALAMAMYCFLRNPNDYRRAVLMGANIEGDSDSVASITGAISGAYTGIKLIPNEWILKIENRELLGRTAEDLYKINHKV